MRPITTRLFERPSSTYGKCGAGNAKTWKEKIEKITIPHKYTINTMTTTNEEKFVTIPFSVWESKYKPMESRVTALEKELEQEKHNKIGTLFLRGSIFSPYLSGINKIIGSIDLTLEGLPLLKIEDRVVLESSIKDTISRMYTTSHGNWGEDLLFLNERKASEFSSQVPYSCSTACIFTT
jgi:hypothetical protein